MVLPTSATRTKKPSTTGASSSSATPDRGSLYEAGKGHILSHFADLATPDVRAASGGNGYESRRMVHGAGGRGSGTQKLRTRRSLDGPNGEDGYGDARMASSSLVSSAQTASSTTFPDDITSNNYRGGTDHDMEDALFGTPSVNENNNDEEEERRELSRQEQLEAWRRQKEEAAAQGTRIPTSSGSKAPQQQRPKAAHSKQQLASASNTSRGLDEGSNNQSHDGEPSASTSSSSQMFTMDFSPPRRNRSNASRRPTLEADVTRLGSLGGDANDKGKQSAGSSSDRNPKSWKDASSLLNASYTSGESFSPAMSMEFLGRDLEDEERALRAKSDKEKAFLYKKRYIDTYGLLVALARRVKNLETMRTDRNTEIELLRSKVHTQERIIETMSQNEIMSLPGDNKQEKRIQSLCREVGVLVQQLGERDSIITHLHHERDESVREMNAIKRSHAACQSGDCGHKSVKFGGKDVQMDASQRSDAEYSALKQNWEVQTREKKALEDHVATMSSQFDVITREKKALEDKVSSMNAKIAEVQHLYEGSESQREALSTGLQHAEEQLDELHSQWTREKTELLNSASHDEKNVAALAADRERLRGEVNALTNSFQVSSENEKKYASMVESQRKTARESQECISRLEAELRDMRAKLGALSDREKHFASVESELAASNQELVSKASRISDLEYDLETKERESRDAETRFQEKSVYLEKRLFQAEIVRRSLHNKVMELKGNIRVFCRVRPVLRHETTNSGNEEIFSFPDYAGERRQIELAASTKSHVSYGQNGGRDAVKKYTFDFDLVFDSTCSQEEVFLEVSALVQSALDGYNVCIFAYGQTGSGKTYTMQGREDSAGFATMEPSSHMGIVGRAITHIYSTISDLRSSGWDFSVSLEMIEIYNETLRDLLAPAGSVDKVDLRLDAEGKPAIANSCIHTVINELDAWQLLQKAMSKRSTKATNMNDRSSRSHCVITFRMSGVNSLTGDHRLGVVHLVDLAGSERLKNSGSGNDRELLKEAQAINKSLSSLGNVICALAKKSAHVPFRDSKLTHFLSPSLGGDSKTLMICNLSPLQQHRDETLNSLRFAKTVNSCEIAYPSISNRS